MGIAQFLCPPGLLRLTVSAHPVSAKGAETRVGQPSFPTFIPQPSFPNWKAGACPWRPTYLLIYLLIYLAGTRSNLPELSV